MAVSPARPLTWFVACVVAGSFAGLGCGSQDEQDVRDGAKEFFAQAAAGDPQTCELASERYRGSPKRCLQVAGALGAPREIEPVDAVNEIEIEGDRATARVVSQGQRLSGLLVLVKENGEWRVDAVEATGF